MLVGRRTLLATLTGATLVAVIVLARQVGHGAMHAAVTPNCSRPAL
jgi:hypothetical protein